MKNVIELKLNSKGKDRKSEPIIRVSSDIYQILKDFAEKTGMSLKDFTETLLIFGLDHIKVSYVD